MATHYDVLGVRSDAPPEDVRRAYLSRARELHPDRAATKSDAEIDYGARRMQEVNEAWRVLRDPGTRAAYDRALAAQHAPPAPAPLDDDDLDDLDDIDDLDRPFHAPLAEPGDLSVSIARAIPWVAILVVLFAIFVFTAFAGSGSDRDDTDDLVGQCIATGSASSVVTVPCSERNEGKVVLIVDRASLCPSGTTSRAIEGNEWLCLR